MIEEGQIVYANLIFRNKKKQIIKANQIILSRPYHKPMQIRYSPESKDDAYIINRCSLKEDVDLIRVDVIKELGYISKT